MTASTSPSAGTQRHVIVTGRSGFIGSRLAQRLERDGVRVTGVSRADGIDITRDALPLDGVDHVYHLGGLSFVPDAWEDPVGYHMANAHGTVRVLDQCRRAGVSMTFISSYVYGSPAPIPVSEKTPPNPTNPYAFSKVAAEDACRFYARTFGLNVSILRPFNVYGPGQSASFLIPTIARQAVDPDCREIVVADLAPRRDFVHVDDVVAALLIAPRLPSGEVFNVGSGASHSIQDVIEACLSAAGASKPVRARGEQRTNEISDVVADISALSAAGNWRPQVTFDAGIKTVIEAMKPC
jgi:nucleoside-diphosphate-sugar epimerase